MANQSIKDTIWPTHKQKPLGIVHYKRHGIRELRLRNCRVKCTLGRKRDNVGGNRPKLRDVIYEQPPKDT
jgi:hypothetical protein